MKLLQSLALVMSVVLVLYTGCSKTIEDSLQSELDITEVAAQATEVVSDYYGMDPIAPKTDRIIVKLTNQVNRGLSRGSIEAMNSVEEVLADSGVIQVGSVTNMGLVVVKVSDSSKPLTDAVERLSDSPSVEYAEPDWIININQIPNDPMFSELWGMYQEGGVDIMATEAWDVTTGHDGIVVAVIDTGVDYNHEDLVDNIWVNSSEIPDNGVDDDNNGYVDDYYGIDAYNNDSDPMDDHSHGTHCAGTIGATGNNATGVVGVCWSVKMMSLKFLSSGGSGYTSGAITCIDYAISKGAHIMSNSWGGGGYSNALYEAIERARAAGILFVAAAGNQGRDTDTSPYYPSSYENENIVSVASITKEDQLSYFSNYGLLSVDLAAPGSDVYSTILDNQYGTKSGTSMATPHASGVAALVKGYNPSLTLDQLKIVLLDTSTEKEYLVGKTVTGGLLNAFHAVTHNTPPEIAFVNLTNSSIVSGNASVQLDASDNDAVERVELWINDVLLGQDDAAPYEIPWDTSSYTDLDRHLLKAMVFDSTGRDAEAIIQVMVNNSGDPAVYIYNPWPNTLCRTITPIDINVQPRPGITRTEFYVDNVLVETDHSHPWHFDWNSPEVDNGSHVLTVKAFAGAGATYEDSINVTSEAISIEERTALIDFYNATSGDGWDVNTNPGITLSGKWKKEDGTFNDWGTEYTWYGLTQTNGHITKIELFNNNLEGIIPDNIGNLGELNYLYLSYNQLTGSFPMGLIDCSNLRYLYLHYNDFSGELPPEIGQLTSVVYLYLYSNRFSGNLPEELGDMTGLRILDVGRNQFTGHLPESLTAIPINYVFMYYNQFKGEIPAYYMNFTSLYDDRSNFSYNGLFTDNDNLRAFLNSKHYGGEWEISQTIPPSNVTASRVEEGIELTWTPISFIQYQGKYRVFYATQSGGPYDLIAETPNKSTSSLTITELSPDSSYYFVMSTLSSYPHVIESIQGEEVFYQGEEPPPDPTFPEITAHSPEEGSTLTGDVILMVDGFDEDGRIEGASIELTDSSGNGAGYFQSNSVPAYFSWDSRGTSDGEYGVTFSVEDNDGNITTHEVFVTVDNVIEDNEPPVVTISSPDGSIVNGLVNVTFTASDNSGTVDYARMDIYLTESWELIESYVSESVPVTFLWDTTELENDGYTIMAMAMDESNNVGTENINVRIDNTGPDVTAPEITVLAPSYGEVLSGLVQIAIDSEDDHGIVDYIIVSIYHNGERVAYFRSYSESGVFNWDTPRFDNGAYLINVKAFDPSNNVGEEELTVSISN